MVHCAGCHCTFSVSGYTHHLRLTRSPACAAAYHARLEQEIQFVEEDNGVAAFSGDNSVFSGDDSAFSGAVFGNYNGDDFDSPGGGGS
jgi:hypothetical protein